MKNIGFPVDEDLVRMLFWLGPDYVETILHALEDGLHKQDPSGTVQEVECLQRPDFETAFKPTAIDPCRTIATRMTASFQLRVMVVDGSSRRWNLYINVIFKARSLDDPSNATYASSFNLIRDEACV